MTLEQILTASAGTGAVSITVKLPPAPILLYDLNAGFNESKWGNIKFQLTAKAGGTQVDQFFHSGISVPSQGHASMISWQGKKYINGAMWDLKIVAIGNTGATDSVYVNGSMEVLKHD